jgi:hypothetical protein
VMLIDGNDERGIDVGLMTSEHLPINPMRSHVDYRMARRYSHAIARNFPW